MDEKGLSLSVPGLCEQTGSDAAPLGVGVGCPTDAGNILVLPTCDKSNDRLPSSCVRTR
jgi:hypothetical protein